MNGESVILVLSKVDFNGLRNAISLLLAKNVHEDFLTDAAAVSYQNISNKLDEVANNES